MRLLCSKWAGKYSRGMKIQHKHAFKWSLLIVLFVICGRFSRSVYLNNAHINETIMKRPICKAKYHYFVSLSFFFFHFLLYCSFCNTLSQWALFAYVCVCVDAYNKIRCTRFWGVYALMYYIDMKHPYLLNPRSFCTQQHISYWIPFWIGLNLIQEDRFLFKAEQKTAKTLARVSIVLQISCRCWGMNVYTCYIYIHE